MGSIFSDHLSYAYGKKQIIKDFSFTVDKSQILYLAGNNGTGKTTWIKNAIGLLAPQSGHVWFDGKRFSDIRESTGIAFDTPPLYPFLNPLENLYVLNGISFKEKDNLDFLYNLGFSECLMKHKASELSLGQKHRLGIAGAILRHPSYLILDEPDLGLDPQSWDVVEERIRQLASEGTCIIITGQNFERYAKLIDQIAVINNGYITMQMNIDSFISEYSTGEYSLKNAFSNALMVPVKELYH